MNPLTPRTNSHFKQYLKALYFLVANPLQEYTLIIRRGHFESLQFDFIFNFRRDNNQVDKNIKANVKKYLTSRDCTHTNTPKNTSLV